MSGAVSSYGTRHLQALFGALGRLARAPLATMLTLIVIGVALALPAGLALMVEQPAHRHRRPEQRRRLHRAFQARHAHRARASRSPRARASGRASTPSPSRRPTQALEEFKQASGFGDALSALEDNPLPHHLVVRPDERRQRPDRGRIPAPLFRGVSRSRDRAARPRLGAPPAFAARRAPAGRCGWWWPCSGSGVLAVIGNTIRLEIQQRRPEIEVTKLVGGSNAFVRRPFLYTGLFYGLGGALLAALIVVRRHGLPRPGGRRACPPSTAAASTWTGLGGAGTGDPGRGRGGSRLAGRPHFHRPAPAADRTPRLSRCLIEQ